MKDLARSLDGPLGVEAAVVDGTLVPGDVTVAGGRVSGVGVTPAEGAFGIAVPGFIDAHINGFAGVDFLGAGPEDYARVAGPLAATGVTAYQPTFVTSAPEVLTRAISVLAAPAPQGPRILGVHLEGPFISPQWIGAHDPAFVLAPDQALAERLCEAGPVTMVTLAPERPGALELIDFLVGQGIAVSCGHSDATAEQAHAAFDRGARAITHIYNGHRRWQARDPGLAGAALVRPEVTVQAIVDDVHLAPETATATARAAGERFSLVTDAIAAAGMPDGVSQLGHQAVIVRNGEARVANGSLAGSVLKMDRALD
ncbi:MAG: amidohydrolase family protein, partial [Solirubrobacterales bacterium]|nr:amidohydrolase family protein [Solirubrobacterales bacterium]